MIDLTTSIKPTISILGCGWYGFALAKELLNNGHKVKGSTTSIGKLPILQEVGIEPFLINFEDGKSEYEAGFFDTEILIISIPPRSKSPNLIDYPNKISSIAITAKKHNVKQIIFISSTGVFQDGNFVVNEQTIPQPSSESGCMMFMAEESLRQDPSLETTIIRFAGLIGPDRNIAKHFAGKHDIANGQAPINLIHLADCIGITKSIIDQKAFGNIYHGVSPDHPSRAIFYTKACIASGFTIPHFTDELLAWKTIESINTPILGYEYQIQNWLEWLNKNTI